MSAARDLTQRWRAATAYALLAAVLVAFVAMYVLMKNEDSPPPVKSQLVDTPTTIEKPFVHISSHIEAENYDVGGPNVAFQSENGGSADGISYRTDHINLYNIEDEGGGALGVGSWHPGDWYNYTVHAGADGAYQFRMRWANDRDGAAFNMVIDGQTVAEMIPIPNTGSKTRSFQTVTTDAIPILTGQHIVKVLLIKAGDDGLGGTLNWIEPVKIQEAIQ